MKIVCIGNSIVNGFPHKRSQCFVSLWRQTSGHEIINKGLNGDTTPNVFERFEKDVIGHKPGMAVILTGTNDYIYQICQPSDTLDYLNKMVEAAGEYAIEPVLMTPLLIDAAMAARRWIPDIDYHEVNRKLILLRDLMLFYGDRKGIRIIDTQQRYAGLFTEENKEDFLVDGLHPTVLGHQAIARFFLD